MGAVVRIVPVKLVPVQTVSVFVVAVIMAKAPASNARRVR